MINEALKHALVDSYDNHASEREKNDLQDWKSSEREVFYRVLAERGKTSLLEVGAGPGKDSLFFKEMGMDVLATDISPSMVELCRSKGLNARVMSFDEIDLPEQSLDAVWALNCLLHVPKAQIRSVLAGLKRVLKPDGLFYMGVYGGKDHEGIWEEDPYKPARFFSFFEDEQLKDLLSEFFTVEYFNVVPASVVGGKFHFQSVILRKPE
ncbi:class I SAM-dependent methyltransferase [Bacillus marinisedimentorum]|uniref:class I SAM-dependent methyltransferase n=1 Tax=Bacillus marinisedimentorum TaxID=1821260 RepID=UPI00087343B5|nr:class I SAM-dependent methyltransferase [Bacillus marinisedimentorum]